MTLKIERSLYLIISSILYLVIYTKLVGLFVEYIDFKYLESIYNAIGYWGVIVESSIILVITSIVVSGLLGLVFKKLSFLSILVISLSVFIFNVSLINSSKTFLPYLTIGILSIIILMVINLWLARYLKPAIPYTFDFHVNENNLNKFLNLLISFSSFILILSFISLSIEYDRMISRQSYPYLNIIVVIEILLLYKLRFKPTRIYAIISVPLLIASYYVLFKSAPKIFNILF